MARNRNEVDDRQIKKLRQLTFQTFGRPLHYTPDAEKLSEAITEMTGEYVSPQTLRRFFGLVTTAFSPSIKTLNALCAYNGFANWHAFTLESSKQFQPLSLDQEANLYLDFYKIDMQEEGDMNYHNASRNIAMRILFNPQLLGKLSPALAKNPVSQVYFFEHFPYIDGLCTDYKRSIRLYLQKKDASAQIFGNSLLFLSAFLSKKWKEVSNFIDRINKIDLQRHTHPFTVARAIGSNILYQQTLEADASEWIKKAKEWNDFFLTKGTVGFWRYPYFQHMMCEYLNVAGLFEESLQLFQTTRRFENQYEIEQGYPEALQILGQVARSHRNPEKFKTIFEQLPFESVHPLLKKYYRLQGLCNYLQLNGRGKKAQRLIAEKHLLIRQTGFTFFEDYLKGD